MRKLTYLGLCVSLSAASLAQAPKTFNDQNAEPRQVSGYHAIHVSSGIDLYLSQGDEAVAVSASSREYRDRIKTVVEDGELKIYLEPQNWRGDWGNRKLKAYVSVRTLDKLTASGGSDVYPQTNIQSDHLDLRLSGGSDLRGLKLTAHTLNLVQTGGSDASLSGEVGEVRISASGGSDFHGYELVTDNCEIRASGGSDMEITVNKSLSADASGGSDIYYRGNASVQSFHSSGSSSISKNGRSGS
jgi:hypothetical protein